MKELTIEQKAKAYDEALERAKKLQETCDSTAVVGWCEYILPELKEKESEDDRTRKAILTGLIDCRDAPDLGWSDFGGVNIDECIAWIEKQGEQTHAALDQPEVTKTSDQEPEPMFNEGDWVVYDHRPYQVVELPKEGYINLGLRRNGKVEFAPSPYCRHWSIQDADDGDVLASELTDFIFLFRGIKDNKIDFYCSYDTRLEWPEPEPDDRFVIKDTNQYYGRVEKSQDIHPATKGQRDLLFEKMKEEGYEWDGEKKELKKIKPKKLDPDKVIEWLRKNTCTGCWGDKADTAISQRIDRFKKDFRL